MTGNSESIGKQSRRGWRPYMWGGAVALLLLPLVAMQFTREVNWGPLDFAIMGAMLGLVCLGFDLLARQSAKLSYRLGAALAVLACFLLIWVNLAVGFIGDEDNPLNLVFLSVIATFVAGAFWARLQAATMVKLMLAIAGLQALIGIGAFVAGEPDTRGILLGTGMFVFLWLVSALLFDKAARDPG